MRRFSALAVAALVLTVAACQGAPAATDPYQVMYDAHGTWDAVQINIGASVQGGKTPFSIDQSGLKVVVDSTKTRILVHASLPIKQFNIDAKTLTQLGITGDNLDIDVLYDNDALYAKAPALKSTVQLLVLQAGETIDGDLGGWLKLGTKSEFEALAGLAGGSVTPSAVPMATAASAADLKAKLEGAGITLTLVGSEQHAGVDANHVALAIDWAKLSQSDYLKTFGTSQLQSFLTQAEGSTVTGDFWVDRTAKRVVGLDIHATDKNGQKLDMTITAKVPDAGTSFDAPANAVRVPLMGIVTKMVGQLGNQ